MLDAISNIFFLLIISGLLSLNLGCQGQSANPQKNQPVKSQSQPSIQHNGEKTSKPLLALGMPFEQMAKGITSFKLSCNSKIITKLGKQPDKTNEQTLDLRIDKAGNYFAKKVTDPQMGFEIMQIGDWIYKRQRYRKFLKHKAQPRERTKVVNRLYSFLPSYIDLLKRFITFEKIGSTPFQNRKGIHIQFKLNSNPHPLKKKYSGAKKWRETIIVKKIEGKVILDEKTGVPLNVTLNALWQFSAPTPGSNKTTGIPTQIDETSQGTMQLTFQQEITHIGSVKPIKPPEEYLTMEDIRRRRLEFERQILTGEREKPSNWTQIP